MDRNLALARSAVNRLERTLAGSAVFTEELAEEYNRAKRTLAISFQDMARNANDLRQFDLRKVKLAVSEEMRRLFEGSAPSHLFAIRRYSRPHPDIYALLASRVGEPVPGWRLRLLSGDKIHTERRTRELRDLGLAVEVTESNDEMYYELLSTTPDLLYGAAFQLRSNATKSSQLTRSQRTAMIDLAERTTQLPVRTNA